MVYARVYGIAAPEQKALKLLLPLLNVIQSIAVGSLYERADEDIPPLVSVTLFCPGTELIVRISPDTNDNPVSEKCCTVLSGAVLYRSMLGSDLLMLSVNMTPASEFPA